MSNFVNTVHFNPTTGEIMQTGSGFGFFDVAGWTTGELDGDPNLVRPGEDNVDLSSVVERPGLPPLVKIIKAKAH